MQTPHLPSQSQGSRESSSSSDKTQVFTCQSGNLVKIFVNSRIFDFSFLRLCRFKGIKSGTTDNRTLAVPISFLPNLGNFLKKSSSS